jgi:hypothetical protein
LEDVGIPEFNDVLVGVGGASGLPPAERIMATRRRRMNIVVPSSLVNGGRQAASLIVL